MSTNTGTNRRPNRDLLLAGLPAANSSANEDQLLGAFSKLRGLHDHLCPRQVLGVRMGLLAGSLLHLRLPQLDKRLIVFMETDGCGADGVGVATGCWVGRRTMRVLDYGKMAATFVDSCTELAYRIRPHHKSRDRALTLFPEARSRWHAMRRAYQVLPDDQLLEAKKVEICLDLEALISRPGVRVNCTQCGEEIINEREVLVDGESTCRPCAQGAYYRLAS